jgi:hypothetical protein
MSKENEAERLATPHSHFLGFYFTTYRHKEKKFALEDRSLPYIWHSPKYQTTLDVR